MDLKQYKPVHLKCPKCGYDYSCNTNRIEEDYEVAKVRLASINKEMALEKEKSNGKKTPRYNRLLSLQRDALTQIAAIKKARKSMMQEMELQKYVIFKDLIKGILGKDRTIELLQEAEEQMQYNDYDMAIQKFNRFGGA